MFDNIEIVKPEDIEKRSFEIIRNILGDRSFPPLYEPIIKRVIHTTADFDYADNLSFNRSPVESAVEALKSGCNIVTDTKMAASGINKKTLAGFGGKVVCFMDDEETAKEAQSRGITRAAVCMERAAKDLSNRIFAIGNAPTALIRLCELIEEEKIGPSLVIGVPVGFVNVVESKQVLKQMKVPSIIAEGRKGGSNVAAAIVNAIMYMNR